MENGRDLRGGADRSVRDLADRAGPDHNAANTISGARKLVRSRALVTSEQPVRIVGGDAQPRLREAYSERRNRWQPDRRKRRGIVDVQRQSRAEHRFRISQCHSGPDASPRQHDRRRRAGLARRHFRLGPAIGYQGNAQTAGLSTKTFNYGGYGDYFFSPMNVNTVTVGLKFYFNA